MNAMKNKIKSQRGASITFALLLFLVCSVVSIVVVVAGSAATGRMSQRAETDQRYYAVTSAVELLCDDFKGMKVTVEYSKDLSTGNNDTPVVSKAVEKDDTTGTDVKDLYPVLKAVSEKLVDKIANNASTPTVPDDTLQLTTNGAPTGSLTACTIKEYVFKDGRVIFEVSNADVEGATKQNKYTLQAVFDANITTSELQYTNGGKSMKRVITTLEWSENSIKKGAMV